MTPDCRWTRPRIVAYLDGEIDEPDRGLVNEHLSACPACRTVTEAERAMTARVRAAVGAERAPERLVERIRRGLAEIEAEAPADDVAAQEPVRAPGLPRKGPVSRRAMGWSLAMATAAALLLIIGASSFWPGSGRSLVNAMADEHREHSVDRAPQLLELTSSDSAAIESYLAGQLGVTIKLPTSAFPKSRGATCCRNGKQNMGLVACFCEKRSHAVTLFVVKSEGLSLRGLDQVRSDGRDFWLGASGECRAVLWMNGPVCYALVGEFKDQADQLAMAVRTAVAMDVRPGR